MNNVELLTSLAWPVVVLIVALVFGRRILDAVASYAHVEVTSKPMKVTLHRLEKEYDIPKTQIRRLYGLTGHDLWALEAFLNPPDDSYRYVRLFNAQRKAMMYSFVEMGLFEIVGEDVEMVVKPLDLAKKVIEAANELL